MKRVIVVGVGLLLAAGSPALGNDSATQINSVTENCAVAAFSHGAYIAGEKVNEVVYQDGAPVYDQFRDVGVLFTTHIVDLPPVIPGVHTFRSVVFFNGALKAESGPITLNCPAPPPPPGSTPVPVGVGVTPTPEPTPSGVARTPRRRVRGGFKCPPVTAGLIYHVRANAARGCPIPARFRKNAPKPAFTG